MLTYNENILRLDPAANFGRPYQQCSKSVMDTIADPKITFDDDGVCNYYADYLNAEKKNQSLHNIKENRLAAIVDKIKTEGLGKKYDCILGVSGGVDSTYLALKAKEWGLRPLLVHFDNGWNSELAVKNVENVISKLGFDLYTLVVNWDEFKDLQMSYIKASVVDIEVLTDHAISGTIYKLANKYGVSTILSGNNIASEHVLPSHWIFNKADDINIKAIHKQFGKVKLKTYPFFSFKERRYLTSVKKIKTAPLLDYFPYHVKDAKAEIISKLEWRDYGGKHYESIFTRFYQGYILPVKFGIDKRKAHLSNLIFSGQMTKDEALAELQKPIYNNEVLEKDYAFVLKKFGLSHDEFENLMKQPRREHREFKYIKPVLETYPFLKVLKPLWNIIKAK